MDISMKWIVVTGGSKGIGRSILEIFLKEGFHGITCARNEAELYALKREIDEKYSSCEFHTFQADLSDKHQCRLFGDFVKDKTRHIDILVNNAGYFLPGQIQDEEDEVFESMWKANVGSAYFVTRALLPLFLQQQYGHIFSICSTASIIPYVNGGSYCIAKHALLGLNKVLREELKPVGIRVTSILPGATLTGSWKGVDLPEERFMQPDDIGKAVLACWQLSKHSVVEELLLRPQLGDL